MKAFRRFQIFVNHFLVFLQMILPDIYEEHLYRGVYKYAWCQGRIKEAFTSQREP